MTNRYHGTFQTNMFARGWRDKVVCIILGRGDDDKKVREWLTTAARVPVHWVSGGADDLLAAAG